MDFYFASLAILFYSLSAYFQVLVAKRQWPLRRWVLTLGCLGVLMHGALVHVIIDTASGQNLTLLNMVSFCLWVVALLIAMMSLFKPVEMNVIFIFPLAALGIVIDMLFPGHFFVQTGSDPYELVHIFLSVSAVGVLIVAGFQALLYAMLERHLKHKHLTTFLKQFPPLQTQEQLLFQVIWIGFLLLTLVLITSVYFFHSMILSQPVILQKTLLTLTAWLVFVVLLIGRYFWGLRGRMAIYSTIGGVVLLVITYLGSQLVVEAIH
ncbi:MAG TPA: cytochrome c biogenesis protein CcsA [Coxiellaceae bacterium]|nr:cytochrome c biogenesis protein CcsA [Coxiellaceae bacterium]